MSHFMHLCGSDTAQFLEKDNLFFVIVLLTRDPEPITLDRSQNG